ncbi:MAG: Ankyrin-2 [Stictis urceolatum]|nr:Ankyrin-2 [Stictis urceolata]
MRAEVLSSGGTKPGLVKYLIEDAQKLDDVKANHKKAIETIQSFLSQYLSDSWRSFHEEPFKKFVFLPLLFVASLFGMNVDILQKNPSWWWYLPFALFAILSTLIVWLVFKRSNTLEGSLEKRFGWLLARKGEPDLERGLIPDSTSRKAKTLGFPAFGKKRS